MRFAHDVGSHALCPAGGLFRLALLAFVQRSPDLKRACFSGLFFYDDDRFAMLRACTSDVTMPNIQSVGIDGGTVTAVVVDDGVSGATGNGVTPSSTSSRKRQSAAG